MTNTFDPSKPVQTRDGRKARIVATLAHQNVYPLLAVITEADGSDTSDTFTLDGLRYQYNDDDGDLVNVEREIIEYFNRGYGYSNKTAARERCKTFPVLKVVLQGDKVVSTEIIPALEPDGA